jgi:hypothetical protein
MGCTKYIAPSLQIQILPNIIFIIAMSNISFQNMQPVQGGTQSFMKQINMARKLLSLSRSRAHTHTVPYEISKPYWQQ